MSGATVVISPAGYSVAPTFDYYISPTGSDSNLGTLASPWAITSLLDPANLHATANTSANRAAMVSKRVGVLAGTYSLSGLVDTAVVNDTRPTLTIPAGTGGINTVVQSVTPRGAILDGGNAAGGGSYAYAPAIGQSSGGTGYITIDGFEVKNCNGAGINVYFGSGSATNIVIQNNHVHDITTTVAGNNPAFIRGQGWINALIRNNRVHDYGSNVEGSTSALGGILHYFCVNTTHEYNTVYNVQVGIHGKGAGSAGDNYGTTCRYNYIESLLGESVGFLDFTTGATGANSTTRFYNNVVNASRPLNHGGVGSTNATTPTYAQIYNNTFYFNGSDTAGGFCYVGLSLSAGLTFYNNILQLTGTTTGYLGEWDVIDGTIGLSDYNCYTASATANNVLAKGSSSTWMSSPTVYTLGGWRTANSSDAGSIAADNVLNTPTAGTLSSYQLAGGSPCSNSGRVGGVSSGATVDMGAFVGGTPGSDF